MKKISVLLAIAVFTLAMTSIASAAPIVTWIDKIDPATQNKGFVPEYIYVRSAPQSHGEALAGGHYERVLNPDYKGTIHNYDVPEYLYVRSAPQSHGEALGGGHFERVLNPNYKGE